MPLNCMLKMVKMVRFCIVYISPQFLKPEIGVNFTKRVQGLCVENYKIIIKEIKMI